MWKVLNKEVDLWEPTSFLDHVYLGCTQRECEISKKYCGQLQNHVRIANFRGWSREITIPSISSYFFMVLWHGWSCQEMCGTILWVGEKDDSTLQSINTMHWWPPLQGRRIEIRGRIDSPIVLKCSYLACIGRPDIKWSVNKLAILVKNGPKHVTDDWQNWFLMFITQTIFDSVVMWETQHSIADWDCFKTLTSREILKIRNQLQEASCVFLDVELLSQSVGCVRNKPQFRTVQQNRKSSEDWIEIGRDSCSRLYGIWLFLSLETRFRPLKDRWDPLSGIFCSSQPELQEANSRFAQFDRIWS